MEKSNNRNILDHTNSLILALMVKVLFWFSAPLVGLSLLRVPTLGFLPVMGLHIFLGLWISVTYFFRKKVSYNFKALAIVSIFFLIGIGGMITHMKVIYAIPGFILGVVFSSIFFGRSGTKRLQLLQIITLSFFVGLYRDKLNLPQEIFELISYAIIFNAYVIYAIDNLKEKFIIVINDLEQKEHKLSDALDSKARFLTLMGHEIRTPLNGIILSNNELKDIQGEKKKYVDIIDNGGKSLLSIVNDILDITRMETGKMKLSKAPFDFNKLLNDLSEHYTFQAKSKEIEFRLEKRLKSTFYNSDHQRIEQVLRNLLNNSIKFTDSGGIRLEVEELEDQIVKINITDTGIGIDKEKSNIIFEDFEQENADTSLSYGGTGLGLGIVKRIVKLLGGEIEVYSMKNEGTVVEVKFPLAHADEGNDVNEPINSTTFKEALDHSILIVEDHTVNVMLMDNILRKFGFKDIDSSANGKDCLKKLEKKRYDLILMDIRMPLINGLEATKSIRGGSGKNKDVPIIGVSANAFDDDLKQALDIGMNDYLKKPIDISQFYIKIKKILNLS